MTNEPNFKRRAAGGVLLSALGFLTAHLASELTEHTTTAVLAALGIFVAGLVLLESALFRAMDQTFEDEAAKRTVLTPA